MSIDSATVTQSLGMVTTSCRTGGSSSQWLIGQSLLSGKESGWRPAVADLALARGSIESNTADELDSRMLYELKEDQIVPGGSPAKTCFGARGAMAALTAAG